MKTFLHSGVGRAMNRLVDFAVTALGSSAIGSFFVWIGLALHPKSTAGLSLDTYAAIFVLSSVVMSACSAIIFLAFSPFITLFWRLPSAVSICLTAILGGCTYVGINIAILGVSSNKGIVWKFFGTWAFLFPLLIGGVYGSAFGWMYRHGRHAFYAGMHKAVHRVLGGRGANDKPRKGKA